MRVFTSLALLSATVPIPLAGQEPAPVSSTPAGFMVDFDNQDIRVVLSALAAAAGANVTFSNLPEIRTTLKLGQPVPKEQLVDVMRDVAESNGLVMTSQGPLIRIGQAQGPGGAVPGFRPRVELYTYRLKHASAAQLAPVLMSLFAGERIGAQPANGDTAGQQGRANAGQGAVSSDVMVMEQGQGQGQGQGQDQTVLVPMGQNGGDPARVFRGGGLRRMLRDLMNAAAANAAGGAAATADVQSQVRIVAEEPTNTLLVRATAEEWEWIQKIVAAVDLRPLQVLIEAVIVEVTRTKDLNVGVDATVTGARNPKVKADLPSVADARDFVLQLAGGRGTVDFTAALNALATRGDLRVRSLPVIVGQNNKQALLNVGASRPFVSVTQTVPNDPTGRVQTIQYIDVGTKLQITPRINADGYVNLEVAQTANSATNEIQFDAPVLSRREATTQVFLRDGQTTVIGGLADNTRDYTRSGIPILRSLPLIGGLFGSTHRSDVQSELYVFLTPHIISDDADIDRLRDSLQQHSDELRQEPVKPVFPSRPSSPVP